MSTKKKYAERLQSLTDEYKIFKVSDDETSYFYRCPHCPWTSKFVGMFQRHLTSRHRNQGEKQLLWQCDECHYSHPCKGRVTDHKKVHTKPYVCSECHNRFSSNKILRGHMLRHIVEKPYRCPSCTYCAKSKHSLEQHMRKHTGEVLQCDKCGFTTPYQAALRSHLRTKHGEGQEYSCGSCSYTTRSQTSFSRHGKTHTGVKDFSCALCSQRCVDKTEIIRHITRCHTHIKRFACNICDYKACYGPAFRNHLLSHTSIRPYSCSACGYSSIQKGKVERHCSKLHAGEEVPVLTRNNIKLDLSTYRISSEESQQCRIIEVADKVYSIEMDDESGEETVELNHVSQSIAASETERVDGDCSAQKPHVSVEVLPVCRIREPGLSKQSDDNLGQSDIHKPARGQPPAVITVKTNRKRSVGSRDEYSTGMRSIATVAQLPLSSTVMSSSIATAAQLPLSSRGMRNTATVASETAGKHLPDSQTTAVVRSACFRDELFKYRPYKERSQEVATSRACPDLTDYHTLVSPNSDVISSPFVTSVVHQSVPYTTCQVHLPMDTRAFINFTRDRRKRCDEASHITSDVAQTSQCNPAVLYGTGSSVIVPNFFVPSIYVPSITAPSIIPVNTWKNTPSSPPTAALPRYIILASPSGTLTDAQTAVQISGLAADFSEEVFAGMTSAGNEGSRGAELLAQVMQLSGLPTIDTANWQ